MTTILGILINLPKLDDWGSQLSVKTVTSILGWSSKSLGILVLDIGDTLGGAILLRSGWAMMGDRSLMIHPKLYSG
ncbi:MULTISPECIES: hypothetical protein [Oscillatoriales]|uniref:hypothetical protein n=1 Tax=Oscillatoriales TaxID=1150 RepID=UPI0001D0EDAA|nr:hypothetical protein [Arthrospira platensis NCB002]QQW30750.1 hypothetical protein AP9108_08850 [Arthrospira sp. PCC 9108]BAI89698.1 hypothetical protein NIES39_D02780 [Arthrospira platensis NIES-39]